MRAGLLRERIFFQKKHAVQDITGGQNIIYTTILSTKCHKLKEKNVGGEVNAKEEFYDTVLRVQLRNNPLIYEATQAIFNGVRYRIVLLDYIVQDRSIIVHLRKDNE